MHAPSLADWLTTGFAGKRTAGQGGRRHMKYGEAAAEADNESS